MNMTAALLGYGGFVLALLIIGVVGYWKADELETWASRRFKS
jgi:hypothetical protein